MPKSPPQTAPPKPTQSPLPIQSMTGYASATSVYENYSISIEVKSHNNKYFEARYSLPESLAMIEEKFRSLLLARFTRGFFDVSLKVSALASGVVLAIDANRAEKIVEALAGLKEKLGLSGSLNIEHLLHFEGIIQEASPQMQEISGAVVDVFAEAVESLAEFRVREGQATKEAIMQCLNNAQQSLEAVEAQIPRIEQTIRSRVREGFAACLGDSLAQERVVQETALLLVKHSVAEEVARARTHLHQFKRELEQGGVIAKRLDFLCQEINREVNTLASKNVIDGIPAQVVDMRQALENIREQLRNIE